MVHKKFLIFIAFYEYFGYINYRLRLLYDSPLFILAPFLHKSDNRICFIDFLVSKEIRKP